MSDTFYFHAGHYCKLSKEHWNIEEFLEEELNPQFVADEGDESLSEFNEYSDAAVFLHGSCQLFSLALHKEFGFEAYEIHCGSSFHCFCQTNYKGTRVYIDVRGATTNFREFLIGSPLSSTAACYSICAQDLEEDGQLKGKFDAEGLAFAKYLIHKNPEYYNIGTP